jgi:nucleoside-diphosphate-sugar epimerase
MNVVLGAGGRLGGAIAAFLPRDRVATPPRPVYADWWQAGAVDRICRFLEAQGSSPGTVYVAAGLIDPRRPAEEHLQVNYQLARNVVEGATRLGFRVMTFGTVMEQMAGDDTANPYYSSKIRLGRFMEEFGAASKLALHVRIHTLYGGPPPDGFMFLGQIYRALAQRSDFRMSPGAQLREYHHVEDEVRAIARLLESGCCGALTLSHGAPLTLKDLAEHIFAAFECPELLKVGALPAPPHDNYGTAFTRPAALAGMDFRAALPGVVTYLRDCIASLVQP